MCLITSNNKRIADRDISVYKVAKPNSNKITTPVFGKTISIGVRTKDDKVCDVEFDGTFYTVKGGYFHSYENKNDAIRDWGHDIDKKKTHKVFECVIPKGSEYYYSEVGCLYASNEIIVYKNN